MTRAPHFALTAALLFLTACAGEPTQTVTSGETFTKNRMVIVKGQRRLAAVPPHVEERSYLVTCAPGTEGGSPAQRAEQFMAAANRIAGQVTVGIGRSIAQ